jgi:protein SCO1/2
MMNRSIATSLAGICLVLCAVAGSRARAMDEKPQPAPPSRREAAPEATLEVGVSERLGEQIPLDLEFEDCEGQKVVLRDFFDGRRPVILTLNYSNCPMLCSLQLTGLFSGLKEMELDMGQDFQMITVSIDPLETSARAKLTKQKYLRQYERAGAGEAYHCLVGHEKDIKALADSVGFRYKYDAKSKQYVHAAATMFLTPDGHLSRYLYDVQYDPQTVRLALVESSQGKIGTSMDQVLLYCYQYDAVSGKYAPTAFVLMQIGGGLAVLVVGVVLITYWVRETARKSAAPGTAPPAGQPTQPGAS